MSVSRVNPHIASVTYMLDAMKQVSFIFDTRMHMFLHKYSHSDHPETNECRNENWSISGELWWFPRPSENLDPLNFIHSLRPVYCLRLPSFHLNLLNILISIFQPFLFCSTYPPPFRFPVNILTTRPGSILLLVSGDCRIYRVFQKDLNDLNLVYLLSVCHLAVVIWSNLARFECKLEMCSNVLYAIFDQW
jgi:hypothetical protein